MFHCPFSLSGFLISPLTTLESEREGKQKANCWTCWTFGGFFFQKLNEQIVFGFPQILSMLLFFSKTPRCVCEVHSCTQICTLAIGGGGGAGTGTKSRDLHLTGRTMCCGVSEGAWSRSALRLRWAGKRLRKRHHHSHLLPLHASSCRLERKA